MQEDILFMKPEMAEMILFGDGGHFFGMSFSDHMIEIVNGMGHIDLDEYLRFRFNRYAFLSDGDIVGIDKETLEPVRLFNLNNNFSEIDLAEFTGKSIAAVGDFFEDGVLY